MSKIARHQLLITLVHGTWGRRFFPRRQRQNRRWYDWLLPKPLSDDEAYARIRSLWFEEGSLFLARLGTELGDIPHKITPLLWSGANSIYRRDEIAHVLAQHLSAEHTEHPQATQLVIAHSHGGNIALRALYLLRNDASRLCGAEMPTPLVVTLATPFVEVQHADLGDRPSVIRFMVLYAMAYLVLTVLLFIWGGPRLDEFGTNVLKPFIPLLDESGTAFLIAALFALPFAISGFLWWEAGRASARQRHIDDLNDATRLGEVVSAQAQRLLIIRAIDDEASLTLALGTILGYAITAIIAGIGTTIAFIFTHLPQKLFSLIPALGWKVVALAADIIAAVTLSLFGILALARAVHGRELSWSPMECQISTHSTPDAIAVSKIVTLVRQTYVKSLRHGIYQHEDCVKAISDWVRSQLYALPAR
jgi:hypothetical protein